MRALTRLLFKNRQLIRDRVCVEAGAGLGDLTRTMLELGAKKVYCLEDNPLACAYLRKRFANDSRVVIVAGKIEDFKPRENIDLLFQELYGPLLLDESLLCLERLRFRPGSVLPNEGRLLLTTARLKDLRDPLLSADVLSLLDRVLVTDLTNRFKMHDTRTILKWRYGQKPRVRAVIRSPRPADLLVFGMEIRHNGERICGTSDCRNWPLVFTPACPSRSELSFSYRGGYAEVLYRRRSASASKKKDRRSRLTARSPVFRFKRS